MSESSDRSGSGPGPAPGRVSIPAATAMGAVHLAVTDRDRAIAFYTNVVGLGLLDDGVPVRLGSGGRELVVLHPGASGSVPRHRTGLYHLALVTPTKRDFALAVRRMHEIGYPHAPTDHVLTKSDYLWDPDGNGIEIYAETPEDGTWFMNEDDFGARDSSGRLRSGRDPIDLGALFGLLTPDDDPFQPLPAATGMGHVHLHVRDVDEAVRFWGDLIGFDLQGLSRRIGIAFVSAGGYHHHVGLNTWAGRDALPPPEGVAGLRRITVEVPAGSDVEVISRRLDTAGAPLAEVDGSLATRDPSANPVVLRAAG